MLNNNHSLTHSKVLALQLLFNIALFFVCPKPTCRFPLTPVEYNFFYKSLVLISYIPSTCTCTSPNHVFIIHSVTSVIILCRDSTIIVKGPYYMCRNNQAISGVMVSVLASSARSWVRALIRSSPRLSNWYLLLLC